MRKSEGVVDGSIWI